jgi:hypothetical protein
MFHRESEKPMSDNHPTRDTTKCTDVAALGYASADMAPMLALVVATLALLISFPARAQEYRGAALAEPPGPIAPLPDGTRQRFVPQHFDAQGRYVPPHYEPSKKAYFRGYFAADEKVRQEQRKRGYKEPTPDYTTPFDPSKEKPMEGR